MIEIWKSTNSNDDDDENEIYTRCSIECVQPRRKLNKRSIPILSRNIILERGQTDYWQNCETLTDSIITSSCENSTGSASHLFTSSQIKTPMNSNGHIISITTTKRQQPSLLNKSKNIQWNIEGDGKQLRYSTIKSHSDDQLHKYNKYQTKHVKDNNTDNESSSEQINRLVPAILHHTNDASNEIHEGIIFLFSNLKLRRKDPKCDSSCQDQFVEVDKLITMR
jgi:hypothetical protein